MTKSNMKTYRQTLPSTTNKIKFSSLDSLFKESRFYMNKLSRNEINIFYKTGKFSGTSYFNSVDFSLVSARYKQNLGKQVKSTYDGYMEQIYARFKNVVYKSSLSDEDKTALYYIGKSKFYHRDFEELKRVSNRSVLTTFNRYGISVKHFTLARKILKNLRFKAPIFKNECFVLYNTVAEIKESKFIKSHTHVFKISSLVKGKKIKIPFTISSYIKDKPGKIMACLQVGKDLRGKYYIGVVKDLGEPKVNKKTKNKKQTRELGLDIGLSALLTSSSGNQYGLSFFKKLKSFDDKYQKLLKKNQKAGNLKITPEMKKLTNTIKDFVKNEIGRVVNNFLLKEAPQKLHIEQIKDITRNMKKDNRLSKKMRRLLSRSGFSKLPEIIKDKCYQLGIEIVEVNPAYTSQTCLNCGHICKKNRSGAKFHCRKCKHKNNADVQAARHILLRGRSYECGLEVGEYQKWSNIKGELSEIDFYKSNFKSLFSSRSLNSLLLKPRPANP